MKAVVWDIKTKLDEIFAFLNKISLWAGEKEDLFYQSFIHVLIQGICLFWKQIQQFICKTVMSLIETQYRR